MSRLKRLIHEAHRRSLWQVLGAYLAGAWVAYEIVQGLTEGLVLPDWFPTLAVALFIVMLPLVLATAFVQGGVGPRVNRRTLWLVLAIYLLSAWGAYQALHMLALLPDWAPGLAGVLLILLTPAVLWTVFVREGGEASEAEAATGRTADATPAAAATAEARPTLSAAGDRRRPRQFLNWRNVALSGVLLFAVWGIIAAAWLVFSFPGLVLRAEAADFFSAQDRVIVADFENETDQAALALAVREAILTDLDGSTYVRVVDRDQLGDVLERMELGEAARLEASVAVEVARREGYAAVVAGGVAPLGAGYQLTARIIEASSAEVAVRIRETAADETEVLGAVERLARLVRRHLGESLGSLRRAPPLPSVTTSSLEALELYAQGRDLALAGDHGAAIPLAVEAVELDSGFAAAHRALGIWYENIGDPANAHTHVDRAHRYGERLVPRERYAIGALYHAYRGRLDSAAYYYGLAVARFPDQVAAINNLGDVYERMGRYEDARALYRRAVLQRESAINLLNLASAERTLGNQAAADSALARMQENYPNVWITTATRAMNPYYAGDYDRVAEVASELLASQWPFPRAYARWLFASIAAMRGQANAAIALADTAGRLAIEAGVLTFPIGTMRVALYSALAAGAPERARAQLEASAFRDRPLGQAPLFEFWAMGYLANGYAVIGDLAEARQLLARMDSLASAADLHPPGIGEQTRAVIALQQNQPQAALEHLRRAQALEHGHLHHPARLLLADTYAALGRLQAAAAHYDSVASTYKLDFRDNAVFGPLRPLAHERAASVYLALGDTVAALRHLSTFVELWREADPELQPRVEAALGTIAALARDR